MIVISLKGKIRKSKRMTVEMNKNMETIDSDVEVAETINFMLTQPVETLEMLQQRFLTNPNSM